MLVGGLRRGARAIMTSSREVMALEKKYVANNYAPLPCVFSSASGVMVKDPEGKEYFDFLSAYSAVNMGHSHPKIVAAATEQMKTLNLSSRAFFSDQLGPFAQFATEYFGFERILPMNSGAEAVETALKLARRWGYDKKGIPENEAVIVCCRDNFHGRTLAIVSMSTDPDAYQHYGPFLPGLHTIPYDDPESLNSYLEANGKKVAAFLVEPVQGEAGVCVPRDGYLKRCAEICRKHNVLLICDEIQTGLGRAGKLLCYMWENIRPDVVIIGKALGGGVLPMSAVLADSAVMDVFGTHGSTFGGNPLACATAVAALQVIEEEKLVENSDRLGEIFRRGMIEWAKGEPLIKQVRGKGLLNAVMIDPSGGADLAKKWTLEMIKLGVLAKPTHDYIVRLSPPLIITEAEMLECMSRMKQAWANLKASL